MKTLFEETFEHIERGRKGENISIPNGFNKINKICSLRQRKYTLVGGYTGSGKTSLVDFAYVLNPYDWYIKNKNKGIEFKCIYRSMERSKIQKILKWICLKIYQDYNIIVDSDDLSSIDSVLSSDICDIIQTYKEYFNEMLESKIVEVIDGTENPTGVKKHIINYAKTVGELVKIDDYNYTYIPNNPNQITNIVIDHIGKTKTEISKVTLPDGSSQYKWLNKKESIDLLSQFLGDIRDRYGFSPIVVSQLNRSISNPVRLKNEDVMPQIEDFKESGNPAEDADLVIALFNPARYKLWKHLGYDIQGMIDTKSGENRFRSLHVLKNSGGVDDVHFGLMFLGECQYFKELPKADEMTRDIYNKILNPTTIKKIN